MKKRIISCFLVLLILSTFIFNVSAINYHSNFGVFTGTVAADTANQGTSLENIKIDIYSSTLDQQDDSLGLKGYAHEYVFSIYTDADGSFSFTKPSFEFLIIIDINSLPDGYGIEKGTCFYKHGESNDTFLLRTISDVSVKYNPIYDNCVEVSVVTSDRTTVLAPYSISVSDNRLSLKSLSSETYTLTGNVSCSVKSLNFSFEVPFDSMAYIGEAITAQKISATDAMNLLTEKIRNAPDTTTLSQAIFAAQALSNNPTTYSKISKESYNAFRAATSAPSYISEGVYPSNSSTPFRIHYESNGLTSTPSFVTDVYNHLITTRNNLVVTKNFLEPSSNSSSTYMDVYITSAEHTDGAPAVSYSNSNGTAYIVIYNISNLSQTLQLTLKGTISHEYFHCIQNTYRFIGATPGWINESFANWAKITVSGKDSLAASTVNRYLDYTYMSLDDNGSIADGTSGRNYGAVLFPLYLDQYLGGYSTIKKVIEYFGNNAPTSNSNLYAINAITSALSSQNSNFATFFAACAAANYTPKTSYDAALTGWRTAPFISNNYTTTSYPNSGGPYSVNYLAMHYQNFTLPTTGSYSIDFTVNFTGGVVSESRCKLLLTGRSSGNIIERTMTQSSNLYTYSLTSDGSIYSKACIMPVNVGYSTSLSYRLTASLE